MIGTAWPLRRLTWNHRTLSPSKTIKRMGTTWFCSVKSLVKQLVVWQSGSQTIKTLVVGILESENGWRGCGPFLEIRGCDHTRKPLGGSLFEMLSIHWLTPLTFHWHVRSVKENQRFLIRQQHIGVTEQKTRPAMSTDDSIPTAQVKHYVLIL